MINKEKFLEELESSLYTFNELSDGEYGFRLDKENELIIMEEYGEYDDTTNSVGVTDTAAIKLVFDATE